MTEPNTQGGAETAQIEYLTADDCYRESCLALGEAQAMAIQSKNDRANVAEAERLLFASREHRRVAAGALQRMGERTSEHEGYRQRALAHSRLCTQTALRALMALQHVAQTRSARRLLDFHMPVCRHDKVVRRDENGGVSLSETTAAFGSNRLEDRPENIALIDAAVNHLAQQTRDWDFAMVNARDFANEFLRDAPDGYVLREDETNAWLNRRRTREADRPATAAIR